MCSGPTLPSWAAAGGKGDSISHRKGQKVLLFSGKKAGFNSDLKLQHSSLSCWDLCRCITVLRVSKTGQFQFTLSWEIQGSLDFFYFCGKGQTNLNLSILRLQPTKAPSYPLWLSPDLSSPRCICKTVP